MEENQEGHDQEIKDFVKKESITYQSGRNKICFFWMLVVDDYVEGNEIDETSVRFLMEIDIIRRMYENILEEDIIKECGRALNQRGGQVMMMINHYLLAGCIRLNNTREELEHSPLKLHELWWDGIGEWKA